MTRIGVGERRAFGTMASMFVDATRLPTSMLVVALLASTAACVKSEKTPAPSPQASEAAPLTTESRPAPVPVPVTEADAETLPESMSNLPPCTAIQIHKAWHFRGFSSIAPGDTAELVAIHLTHRERNGFGFWLLDANGKRFDTDTQLVRADAKGTPIERFGIGIEALDGPVDLVVIGAVTKGTRKMKFAVRDGRKMFAQPSCAVDLDVVEGPAWPAAPSIDIVRFATTGPKRYLALVRVKGLLPEEWPAPQLQRALNAQRSETALGDARAIARVDAQGKPLASNAPSTERYVAAEYEWHPDGTPTEWVSWVAEARPLPAASAWPISDDLRTALDESAETSAKDGREAAAAKAFGAAPKR